ATVTARLTSGLSPLTLLSSPVPAGPSSFSWNLGAVPDGRYQIELTAKLPSGATATQTVPVVVDRLGASDAPTPAIFSPTGDGVGDTATITFTLAQSVPVQVLIERFSAIVATVFVGQLGPGPQAVGWNGMNFGARVPDGTYDAVTLVGNTTGTTTLSAP